MKRRNLLMIPGPIEFDPAVLAAMAIPTTSHVAPEFIEIFGSSLEKLRQVFLSDDGQPFILAGSGTLAMDTAGANLVEPGDRALVVNCGYFADRFADLLARYGVQVDQVRAPIGDHPSLDDVKKALQSKDYKLVTITHVDTSTGVLADVQNLARLVVQSSGALVVVDGVCSVAGEELRMSEWGIDLILTASQKAIGVPPGLALVVAGPRAIAAFKARKTPVASYYADWNNWLPVMEAYQSRKPGYFGTPAVNLVVALYASLEQILAESMPARFARHQMISQAVKAATEAMHLAQVPCYPQIAANTMTAPRFPNGVNGADLLKRVTQKGVLLAGGLHPAIRAEYFRIGHMGEVSFNDILATVGAIESALLECGYPLKPGVALEAAQASRDSR